MASHTIKTSLAGAIINTPLSNIPIPVSARRATIPGNPPVHAQIIFNNESGFGLLINLVGSNRQFPLPAGGWTDPLDLYNQDSAIAVTPDYSIPNAPVNTLYVTVYDPGESPLKLKALGNSPIGISSAVSVTNLLPSNVITDNVQADDTFNGPNDYFFATIVHFAISLMGTGGVLTIADKLKLTNATQFDASVSFPGSQVNGAVPLATQVAYNGASTTSPQLETGTANAGLATKDNKPSGWVEFYPTMNDATARGIQFDYIDSAGNLHAGFRIDGSGTSTTFGLTQNSLGQVFHVSSFFNGSGAGTFSHGLGATPTWVGITENVVANTMTVGVDTIGATTVHVDVGNPGQAWIGMATD